MVGTLPTVREALLSCGFEETKRGQEDCVYWANDTWLIDTTVFMDTMLEVTEESESLQSDWEDFSVERLKHIHDLMNEWALTKSDYPEKGRSYGDDQNNFDTDFQFETLEIDGTSYVLIHGNASGRWCKTPHVFKVSDIDYFYDWRINGHCEECAGNPYSMDEMDRNEDFLWVGADPTGIGPEPIIFCRKHMPAWVAMLDRQYRQKEAEMDAAGGELSELCTGFYNSVKDEYQGRVWLYNSGQGW